MTLLVTGGNGFIGLNLMEYCTTIKKPCILMSDTPPNSSVLDSLKNRIPNFNWVQGDVRNSHDLNEICRRFEIKKIVNAAALTAELPREIVDTKKIFEVKTKVISPKF